ncbi:MAG: ABC transporter ATP-binding protein [Vicinamibacterales bacterium]
MGPSRGDHTLYRRLLSQTRPYWLHLSGLFALGLLASPIALLNPLPVKIAVDSVVDDRPLPKFLAALVPDSVAGSATGVLLLAAALFLATALTDQVRALASKVLETYTSERLVLEFRGRLFNQIQRLSISYHDSRGTADSVYRIQQDAPAIKYLVVEGAIPAVSAAVTFIAMLYVMLRLDWQLALVALSIAPVLMVLAGIYRRRMRLRSREIKKLESSVLGVVQETLGALRVVKAFRQEERESGRFVRQSNEGVRARIRLAMTEGIYGLLAGATTAVGMALVLIIGIRHVVMGVLTLGQLLLVMGYLGQLYAPLRTLSRKASGLQSHMASLERALALLDEPSDVPERSNALALRRAMGAITFRGVRFAYDSGHSVLHDVSFEIRSGARVAVTGATGAGKTTLVNLLIRLYDPTEGKILLDGVDLRDYRVADLRDQFAIVLQQPVLFSTTIAENIAYGRPGAGERDVAAAADAAGAHDFIMNLPRGYDTQVGERGMKLSGGERQRIALARAFLKNAPLLILDEPTSAVDLRTEAVIMDALTRLMRDRTVFLISHRVAPLSMCDVRLHLHQGRLHEAPPSRAEQRL